MTAYFMRHAQAFHNEFYRKHPDESISDNPRYIDPGLTPTGINSICNNRDAILSKLPHIDVVLMSPLKRAIQTVLYLYMDILPLPQLYITYSLKEGKDISGSDPNTYQVKEDQADDLDLLSFKFYDDIKYLDTTEIISVDSQISKLKGYLQKFSDKNILIITHSGIIKYIFEECPEWLTIYETPISKL